MSRFITASVFLLAASCAQLDGGTIAREDRYSAAAMSWMGGNIHDMAAAWPSPNKRCGSNKTGEAGCVWWRQFYESHHNCEVIVQYDSAGTITVIDVKRSFDCHRLFRNDQFNRMTRRKLEQ